MGDDERRVVRELKQGKNWEKNFCFLFFVLKKQQENNFSRVLLISFDMLQDEVKQLS